MEIGIFNFDVFDIDSFRSMILCYLLSNLVESAWRCRREWRAEKIDDSCYFRISTKMWIEGNLRYGGLWKRNEILKLQTRPYLRWPRYRAWAKRIERAGFRFFFICSEVRPSLIKKFNFAFTHFCSDDSLRSSSKKFSINYFLLKDQG